MNLSDKKPEKESLGKRAKKSLQDWLHENVNQPLADRGYEEAGAGISAVGAAVGDLLIPESKSDLALMALGPAGKVLKAGSKAAKFSKLKKPKRYKDMTPDERAAYNREAKRIEATKQNYEENLNKAIKKKQKEAQEGSTTLDYSKMK